MSDKKTRISKSDIKDELLASDVNAAILADCDDFLGYLAGTLGGVAVKGEAKYTIMDIPDPMPYLVKQLAIAWVCREICSRKAGSAGTAYIGRNTQDPPDIYGGKLRYYSQQVQSLQSQITADILFGRTIATAVTFGTISLERG